MAEMKTIQMAAKMRRVALETCLREGGGNLCQAFSTAETMAALFNEVLNLQELDEPMAAPDFKGIPGQGDISILGGQFLGEKSPERDIFFFSPPHYSTALYSALVAAGRLKEESMLDFGKDGTTLVQIGEMISPGYEAMSGSLGQAISVAAGYAIARKMKGETGRVFVFVGDGECETGQTWEALQAMGHHKLNNMTVIMDKNDYQCDDSVENVLNNKGIEQRFESFGCRTFLIDGHDIDEFVRVANMEPDPERPTAILCDTDPWHGLEDIKNHEPRYHYINFSEEEKAHYTGMLEREEI